VLFRRDIHDARTGSIDVIVYRATPAMTNGSCSLISSTVARSTPWAMMTPPSEDGTVCPRH
jgi:hypothetical protein